MMEVIKHSKRYGAMAILILLSSILASADGTTDVTAAADDENSAIMIYLNSPANNSYTRDSTPVFNFTAINGKNVTMSCGLIINSNEIGQKDNVLNNITTVITANSNLSDYSHTWWINCTVNDTPHISENSEKRILTVDTVPPKIISTVIKGHWNGTFSPNGDGVYDKITINVSASEVVRFNRIGILNSLGNEVKYFRYSNYNSTTIVRVWNGSNSTGGSVPDGFYTINTTITDLAGNTNAINVGNITVDNTPPVGISDLLNASQGNSWIYWTWMNPDDADFNYTEIWINGVFYANTSDNFYNATGLNSNSYYEIQTRTFDSVGNRNSKWVRSMARKMDTPPSISSVNVIPGLPDTNNNLNCSFTVSDLDIGDILTANVRWFKDSIWIPEHDNDEIDCSITYLDHLVISEVLYYGNSKDDEYVVLYNPTNATVLINSSWKIGDNEVNDTLCAGSIVSGGYYLIADSNSAYADFADCILSAIGNGLKNNDDSISLYYNSIRVDGVGWGSSSIEGSSAPVVSKNQVIRRTPMYRDSKDNSVDFTEGVKNPKGRINGTNPVERTCSTAKLVDGRYTARGENWTCRVTTYDNYGGYVISNSSAIVSNSPPSSPLLISPANGTSIINNIPEFTWNSSTDSDNDIVSYLLNISGTLITTTATVYKPASGLAPGQYSWKIRANDSFNSSDWSNTWTFNIAAANTNINRLSITYSPTSPYANSSVVLYVRPFGNQTELVTSSYIKMIEPGRNGYAVYPATNGSYTISSLKEGVYAIYAIKPGWEDSITVYINAVLNHTTAIAAGSMVINEIMYNPTQDDAYNEWIEIYNPSENSIDVTAGWMLCDERILAGYVNRGDSSTYNYLNSIIPAKGYAVITDGNSGTDVYSNFNVSNSAISLHVDANSLCGGLTNTGGTIILRNSSGAIVDSVTYSNSWGANGNGKTLEGVDSGNWKDSLIIGGTPGYQNDVYLQTINNTANVTSATVALTSTTTSTMSSTTTLTTSTTSMIVTTTSTSDTAATTTSSTSTTWITTTTITTAQIEPTTTSTTTPTTTTIPKTNQMRKNMVTKISADTPTTLDVPEMGLEMEIVTNETVMANVTIIKYSDNPTGVNLSGYGISYVSIEANDELNNALNSAFMTFYYKEYELPPALNENSISFYYFNKNIGQWENVDKAGTNAKKNYTWANLSRFGYYYAIAGIIDEIPPGIISTIPKGIIYDSDVLIEAVTDESAVCRFDIRNRNYEDMRNEFNQTWGIIHRNRLNLSEGTHTYYVRCRDFAGNLDNYSAEIRFTVEIHDTGTRGDFNMPAYEGVIISKCTDGMQDYGETWIDCGGPCKPCTTTTTTATSTTTTTITLVTTTVTVTTTSTTTTTTLSKPPGLIGQVTAVSAQGGWIVFIAVILITLGYLIFKKDKGDGEKEAEGNIPVPMVGESDKDESVEIKNTESNQSVSKVDEPDIIQIMERDEMQRKAENSIQPEKSSAEEGTDLVIPQPSIEIAGRSKKPETNPESSSQISQPIRSTGTVTKKARTRKRTGLRRPRASRPKESGV